MEPVSGVHRQVGWSNVSRARNYPGKETCTVYDPEGNTVCGVLAGPWRSRGAALGLARRIADAMNEYERNHRERSGEGTGEGEAAERPHPLP